MKTHSDNMQNKQSSESIYSVAVISYSRIFEFYIPKPQRKNVKCRIDNLKNQVKGIMSKLICYEMNRDKGIILCNYATLSNLTCLKL